MSETKRERYIRVLEDELKSLTMKMHHEAYFHEKTIKGILQLLKEEPERKKGKWIVTSEFEDCRYVKCNQCKVTQVFYYNKPLTNFCPECGSYNRGEQE